MDDIRESPALDLLHLLHERGAELSYSDPFVPEAAGLGVAERRRPGARGPVTKAAAGEFDCIVVVTDHSSFDYDHAAARGQGGRRHAQRDQVARPARRSPRCGPLATACPSWLDRTDARRLPEAADTPAYALRSAGSPAGTAPFCRLAGAILVAARLLPAHP